MPQRMRSCCHITHGPGATRPKPDNETIVSGEFPQTPGYCGDVSPEPQVSGEVATERARVLENCRLTGHGVLLAGADSGRG